MAVERAVLLIADIGGYTRFMQVHRRNLAHAQEIISALLEAVIGAAGRFRLAKLEGDAAFMWQPAGAACGNSIADMRRAFLKQKGALVGERLCTCESCMQIENLRLKFVVHEGEVVRQKVAGSEELAGVDVIVVHRMLKNDVPLRDYVLATDAALEHAQTLGPLVEIAQDLEGIGSTRTHYVDLAPVQLVDVGPPVGMWMRLARKVRFEARTVPYLLGFKEPCAGFGNAPSAAPSAVPSDQER